jgi:hypothetical protein
MNGDTLLDTLPLLSDLKDDLKRAVYTLHNTARRFVRDMHLEDRFQGFLSCPCA